MTEQTPQTEPTFESQMAQLEALVEQLERGGLGLKESIEAYERATALCAALEAQLTEGEKRLTALQDGQERPFDLGDTP